jgi:hypothetical protein
MVMAVAVVVGWGHEVRVAVDVLVWVGVTWWCGIGEFFLVATPTSANMIGFFKQWVKALPDSLLLMPIVLTLSSIVFLVEGIVVLLLECPGWSSE